MANKFLEVVEKGSNLRILVNMCKIRYITENTEDGNTIISINNGIIKAVDTYEDIKRGIKNAYI